MVLEPILARLCLKFLHSKLLILSLSVQMVDLWEVSTLVLTTLVPYTLLQRYVETVHRVRL